MRSPAAAPVHRPHARRLATLAAAALLALPAAAAGPAPAEPATLRVEGWIAAGRLQARLDLAPALDAELERRLGSGLATTVRLTVAALGASGAAAAARDFDVRFDVWQETFTVTIREGETAVASRQGADWATVRGLLASPAPFDLGPRSALPPVFAVEARLELDPVTSRQLEKTREQLTHPMGGPSAGARSVLGTLAALLLRSPPPVATRSRSGPLTLAELPTR
jgi:hypothetical protein